MLLGSEALIRNIPDAGKPMKRGLNSSTLRCYSTKQTSVGRNRRGPVFGEGAMSRVSCGLTDDRAILIFGTAKYSERMPGDMDAGP